jgi:hypothetical protein
MVGAEEGNDGQFPVEARCSLRFIAGRGAAGHVGRTNLAWTEEIGTVGHSKFRHLAGQRVGHLRLNRRLALFFSRARNSAGVTTAKPNAAAGFKCRMSGDRSTASHGRLTPPVQLPLNGTQDIGTGAARGTEFRGRSASAAPFALSAAGGTANACACVTALVR